jgi:hypothetical protein
LAGKDDGFVVFEGMGEGWTGLGVSLVGGGLEEGEGTEEEREEEGGKQTYCVFRR